MTLTNRALLVSLKISQWSARKFDRKETAELALKHGTAEAVARVNKSLLPMSKSLEVIHKKTNEIRWAYYNNSLPWGQQGVQVISTAGYMDFVKLMREGIESWRALTKEFFDEYPTLRENARVMLNGMYKAEDYPDLHDLQRKFDIDVRFSPIPDADDWRVGLADDEIERLKEDLGKELRESQHIAMKDAWKRMHDVVSHAVGRLSDPKTVFRDTLIDNAKEMCRVLTVLNIAEDPDLERIRSQIEGTLCGQSVEVLREDPAVRQQVNDKMKEIMAKMGAFYEPA